MREDFLHFVWQYQLFDARDLQTTRGQSLNILRPGRLNPDAGPDFYEAHLLIDGMRWVGQVEVHVTTADWHRHRHSGDLPYEQIVLHVVWEETIIIQRKVGEEIPCLTLKDRIPFDVAARFRQLTTQRDQLPCTFYWPKLSPGIKRNWMERLMLDRMEQKMEFLRVHLRALEGDWEQLVFEVIAGGFGLSLNVEPFRQVARSISIRKLQRLGNLRQLEALLLGQANLLGQEGEEAVDSYQEALRQEYIFHQRKWHLQPITAGQWRLMRMRPSGFPERRLAALAAFLFQTTHLRSKVMVLRDPVELDAFFNLRLPLYWNKHYRFGKAGSGTGAAVGRDLARRIAINGIIPLQMLYAMQNEGPEIWESALDLLRRLEPEDNRVVRQWVKMGWIPESAGESQSLIHLKKAYCDPRRCLQCSVGQAAVFNLESEFPE